MAVRDYIMADEFDKFMHDALDRVEQHSTLEEFFHQFEAIRQLISLAQPLLTKAYFASRFVYGLCADIQEYVIRSQPTTVIDAFHLSCVYESNFSLANTLIDVDVVNIISTETMDEQLNGMSDDVLHSEDKLVEDATLRVAEVVGDQNCLVTEEEAFCVPNATDFVDVVDGSHSQYYNYVRLVAVQGSERRTISSQEDFPWVHTALLGLTYEKDLHAFKGIMFPWCLAAPANMICSQGNALSFSWGATIPRLHRTLVSSICWDPGSLSFQLQSGLLDIWFLGELHYSEGVWVRRIRHNSRTMIFLGYCGDIFDTIANAIDEEFVLTLATTESITMPPIGNSDAGICCESPVNNFQGEHSMLLDSEYSLVDTKFGHSCAKHTGTISSLTELKTISNGATIVANVVDEEGVSGTIPAIHLHSDVSSIRNLLYTVPPYNVCTTKGSLGVKESETASRTLNRGIGTGCVLGSSGWPPTSLSFCKCMVPFPSECDQSKFLQIWLYFSCLHSRIEYIVAVQDSLAAQRIGLWLSVGKTRIWYYLSRSHSSWFYEVPSYVVSAVQDGIVSYISTIHSPAPVLCSVLNINDVVESSSTRVWNCSSLVMHSVHFPDSHNTQVAQDVKVINIFQDKGASYSCGVRVVPSQGNLWHHVLQVIDCQCSTKCDQFSRGRNSCIYLSSLCTTVSILDWKHFHECNVVTTTTVNPMSCAICDKANYAKVGVYRMAKDPKCLHYYIFLLYYGAPDTFVVSDFCFDPGIIYNLIIFCAFHSHIKYYFSVVI